ncbi:MAG: hypothetical protein LBV47_09620, partial [Bacteroidales bacterium]|nr:hypothetical protein [Bacteroidales bacterium]
NIAFGATLTHLASLPANSKLNLSDPFSGKKSPWLAITVILLFLTAAAFALWHFGAFSRWGIF